MFQYNEDMKDSALEVQIDTSNHTEKKSHGVRTMGTRKNPKDFGKVPNVIKNQSDMSYDESSNIGFM